MDLNEIEIRAVIDEFTNSIRNKDVDGVVSHYAEKNVMFSLAPPLEIIPEVLSGKADLRDWFSSFHGPIGLESKNLVITAGNDIGLSHSLRHLAGMKSNGETVDLWYRETLGFCKINAEWKIMHQHQSVPFYMDGSNKAAMDLRPE
jgi:PhnB protein